MKIKNPNTGKTLTPGQYLALRHLHAYQGDEYACRHGHPGCAAWERGPCTRQVRVRTSVPCPTRGCSNTLEYADDDHCPWCRERLEEAGL